MRKLNLERIQHWLEKLSGQEMDFLVHYHQCCVVAAWDGYGPKNGALKPEMRKLSDPAISIPRHAVSGAIQN